MYLSTDDEESQQRRKREWTLDDTALKKMLTSCSRPRDLDVFIDVTAISY